jgi:thymidylate synthase, flavin-dependent
MTEESEPIVVPVPDHDPIIILEAPTVELIDSMGTDNSIVRSARVSVTGEQTQDGFPDPLAVFVGALTEEDAELMTKRAKGLINYLMRERHGSVFEHNSMTFYVKGNIFSIREFMRHRIGFSYNERSGRYSKLQPEFWIPSVDRPLINIGTSSKPEMAPGTGEQYDATVALMTESYEVAWAAYEKMLANGIANEVARAVLPLGIYTEMYVTMNLRSALSFLALRTHEPTAKHISRPQLEIEEIAREIEREVARLFPVAYESWVKNGRVAP